MSLTEALSSPHHPQSGSIDVPPQREETHLPPGDIDSQPKDAEPQLPRKSSPTPAEGDPSSPSSFSSVSRLIPEKSRGDDKNQSPKLSDSESVKSPKSGPDRNEGTQTTVDIIQTSISVEGGKRSPEASEKKAKSKLPEATSSAYRDSSEKDTNDKDLDSEDSEDEDSEVEDADDEDADNKNSYYKAQKSPEASSAKPDSSEAPDELSDISEPSCGQPPKESKGKTANWRIREQRQSEHRQSEEAPSPVPSPTAGKRRRGRDDGAQQEQTKEGDKVPSPPAEFAQTRVTDELFNDVEPISQDDAIASLMGGPKSRKSRVQSRNILVPVMPRKKVVISSAPPKVHLSPPEEPFFPLDDIHSELLEEPPAIGKSSSAFAESSRTGKSRGKRARSKIENIGTAKDVMAADEAYFFRQARETMAVDEAEEATAAAEVKTAYAAAYAAGKLAAARAAQRAEKLKTAAKVTNQLSLAQMAYAKVMREPRIIPLVGNTPSLLLAPMPDVPEAAEAEAAAEAEESSPSTPAEVPRRHSHQQQGARSEERFTVRPRSGSPSSTMGTSEEEEARRKAEKRRRTK